MSKSVNLNSLNISVRNHHVEADVEQGRGAAHLTIFVFSGEFAHRIKGLFRRDSISYLFFW